MRWLLLAATGCGRLAFDPFTTDAPDADVFVCNPVGHDEDGDLIDDACDVCPHLADASQGDRDGDRVGDVCDPNPDEARDRIAYFDPFVTQRPEWTINSPMGMFIGDAYDMDGRSNVAVSLLPATDGEDTLVLGGRITGTTATGTRQITVGFRNPSAPAAYFCEIAGDETDAELRMTYTPDGASFTVPSLSPLMGLIADRNVTLGCSRAGPQWRATGAMDSPATMDALQAATPALVSTRFAMTAQGVRMRVDYFIHIRSE